MSGDHLTLQIQSTKKSTHKTHFFPHLLFVFAALIFQDQRWPPLPGRAPAFLGLPTWHYVRSRTSRSDQSTASGSEWGHSGPWFQEKRIGSGKDLHKSSGIHVYSHLSDHLPSELRYKPAWEVMLCLLPFRSRSARKTRTHQEDAGEKVENPGIHMTTWGELLRLDALR